MVRALQAHMRKEARRTHAAARRCTPLVTKKQASQLGRTTAGARRAAGPADEQEERVRVPCSPLRATGEARQRRRRKTPAARRRGEEERRSPTDDAARRAGEGADAPCRLGWLTERDAGRRAAAAAHRAACSPRWSLTRAPAGSIRQKEAPPRRATPRIFADDAAQPGGARKEA